MPSNPFHADIAGHWKKRSVSINGKRITVERFVSDLKADEEEPDDNQDVIRECKGVRASGCV